MNEIISLIFNSAYASPGSGHSHGPEGDSVTVGIIIIVVISAVVFWFLSKKK